MLINYNLNHVAAADEKNDKTKSTNTFTPKSADNATPNGTRFQLFSEISGNMETQLGKSVKFEVNRGLVMA